MLQLEACRRVHGPANEVLFLGPRVKMGIYEGRPTRICPHTTTGRADYFGPFVNRQALPPVQPLSAVLVAQLWPSLHSCGPTQQYAPMATARCDSSLVLQGRSILHGHRPWRPDLRSL